ncbi:MAG TPA: insulinase family protein, partial [Bacteroidia bacterium]|nr:insulinase family protein [Bacteroidia bacterium]
MLSSIGAKGTNAYTSVERTVYINDIPSNMIGKWLKIEGERFRNPVLRLFHTELEAVYEEKNISLDNDRRTVYAKLMETVFPTHNYGQQTTIGTVEHLKNPSIKKIKEYFSNYYVPNNMAICLSGDFDPDQVVRLIDQNFGGFQTKPVSPYNGPEEKPLKGIQRLEVFGPEAEFVNIGFRVPGVAHADMPAIEMIDYLLSNSTAGLIDLNLVKQQKVLEAYGYTMTNKDYGVYLLGGSPKEGQRLEDVEEMLLAQLEMVKKGQFEPSLVAAVVNDMEIQQMRQYESNRGRTGGYIEAFITNQDWADFIQKIDKMRKLTKEDIVRVANQYYKDNYVVVYKRNGERANVQKVVKPQITPVEVNREAQSEFLKALVAMEAPAIAPRFLNYDTDIQKSSLNSGVTLHYVKNEENSLFTLYYLLDFGKNQDKTLAFAIEYLPFLGTDKYSADDISKKFYELGTSFDVSSGDDQIYVYVSGLAKNFDASVELFEHLLKNAKPDNAALASLIDRTVKSRNDAKLNKGAILWRGMQSYGLYGAKNPFNDVLKEDELRALSADALVEKIKHITDYQHRALYYGPANSSDVAATLSRLHITPASLTPVPKENPYQYTQTTKTK